MKKPLITLGLSGAIGYYFYNKLAKAGFAPSYNKTEDVKMPENQSLINDECDVNNNMSNAYVEEVPADLSYVNNEQPMDDVFEDDMESTILTVEDEEQQPEENPSEYNNVEYEYDDVSVAPPLIHTDTEHVPNNNENNSVDAVDDENEFTDEFNDNPVDDLFANFQNTANENMPEPTMDEMPDSFANNSNDVVLTSNDTSSADGDADNNYVRNPDDGPNTMVNSTPTLNQSDVSNAMLTDDELNDLVNGDDLFGDDDATSEFDENANAYTNADPNDLFDVSTLNNSTHPQETPAMLNQNVNQMEDDDDDLFDSSNDDPSSTVNNNNETVMNVSESLHKCNKDDQDAQKEYNSIVDFFNQF